MSHNLSAGAARILVFVAAISGVALTVSQSFTPQATQAVMPLPGGWSIGTFLMPH